MADTRPYRVYAANPFVRMPNGSLAIDYRGLKATVGWFKEKGVTVISTTMAGKDVPGMRSFVDAANQAGMVVIASVGNDGFSSVPFPAAYPDTIAIDGYHHKRKSGQATPFMVRADAVFDGSTGATSHPDGVDRIGNGPFFSGAPDRAVHVAGSSFAVARASAFLAARMVPGEGLKEARRLVTSVYTVRGRPVDLSAKRQPSAPIDLSRGPGHAKPTDDVTLVQVAFKAGAGVSR